MFRSPAGWSSVARLSELENCRRHARSAAGDGLRVLRILSRAAGRALRAPRPRPCPFALARAHRRDAHVPMRDPPTSFASFDVSALAAARQRSAISHNRAGSSPLGAGVRIVPRSDMPTVPQDVAIPVDLAKGNAFPSGVPEGDRSRAECTLRCASADEPLRLPTSRTVIDLALPVERNVAGDCRNP